MSHFRDTIKTIDLTKIAETEFPQRFVGAIILTHNNKFILQRIVDPRPFFPAGSLTTFGGKIEANETPEEALMRELKEELGAIVNTDDTIFLGAITESATGHSELIYTYFWQDKKGTITGCYEDEIAYFDSLDAIVVNDHVTDDVRWMLYDCRRRRILPTESQKTEKHMPEKIIVRKAIESDIEDEIVSARLKNLSILTNKNNFPWLFDAHCDTVYHKHWFQNKMDLSEETTYLPQEVASRITAIFGETISAATFPWQITLNKLQEGHVGAVVVNIGDCDLEASRIMLNSLDVLIEKHAPLLAICRNKTEIDFAVTKNKIAIIPAIEGMLMFHHNLDLLHSWHARGITFANLTHGEGTDGVTNFMRLLLGENAEQYCQYALQITPSTERFMPLQERSCLYKNEKGLNDFGQSALKEMEKLRMICDLSHANDATFWEALELTQGKFCVTHSNCAALCPHTRNLTDEMMKALADAGGVMGLCFFGEFIDPKNPSLEKFIEHVLHALDIMGTDHVGIGSDYDGVGPDAFMAIAHPGLMNNLWVALEKAGIDKKTMAKIAHENFLRLLNN